MDGYTAINNTYSAIEEIMSDNYYLTTALWNSVADKDLRGTYIWIRESQSNIGFWNPYYSNILTANVVLENLETLSMDDCDIKDLPDGIFDGLQ